MVYEVCVCDFFLKKWNKLLVVDCAENRNIWHCSEDQRAHCIAKSCAATERCKSVVNQLKNKHTKNICFLLNFACFDVWRDWCNQSQDWCNQSQTGLKSAWFNSLKTTIQSEKKLQFWCCLCIDHRMSTHMLLLLLFCALKIPSWYWFCETTMIIESVI